MRSQSFFVFSLLATLKALEALPVGIKLNNELTSHQGPGEISASSTSLDQSKILLQSSTQSISTYTTCPSSSLLNGAYCDGGTPTSSCSSTALTCYYNPPNTPCWSLTSNTVLCAGSDLASSGTSMYSLAQAQYYCGKDASCKGITFQQSTWPQPVWFKSSSACTVSAKGWTAYLPVPCQTAAPSSCYSYVSNSALSNGNDIIAPQVYQSLNDALNECAQLNQCIGITFSSGTWPQAVWLKNANSQLLLNEGNGQSLIVQPCQLQSQDACFSSVSNTYICNPATLISYTLPSFASASYICGLVNNCAGFTYQYPNTWPQNVWFHSSAACTGSATGWVAVTKGQCAQYPTPPQMLCGAGVKLVRMNM